MMDANAVMIHGHGRTTSQRKATKVREGAQSNA